MNGRLGRKGTGRRWVVCLVLPLLLAGPGWAGNTASSLPAGPGAPGPAKRSANRGELGGPFRGAGLTRLLWPGLLLWLAAGSGSPFAGNGQAVSPGVAGGPSLDLSGTPTAATEAVHLALGRANRTGTLPPLEALNAVMASHSPGGVSPLAALPPLPTPPGTAASGPEAPVRLTHTVTSPPSLPGGEAQPAAAKDPARERLPLLATLKAARLIETQATLLSIAYQFLAIANFLTETPEQAVALRVVAMELQSMAFAFGAEASHTQALEAERQLSALDHRRVWAGDAGLFLDPEPESGFFATQAAQDPARFMSSEILFGTWQRLENTPSGDRVRYRISPRGFTKYRTGTDENGDQEVSSEHHPGAVTSSVSYRIPGPRGGTAQGKEGVKVKLRVDKADGPPLVLTFSYLRARGAALEESGDGFLDVLVEAAGEQKAFVRISAPPGLAGTGLPGMGLLSQPAVGQEGMEP